MENASKALIIAGSILISILIIALGMYIFAQSSGSTDDSTLSTLQIQQFNGKFDRYKARQTGVQVSALLDNLNSNAIGKTKNGEKPNIIFCAENAITGTAVLSLLNVVNYGGPNAGQDPKAYIYRIPAQADEKPYRQGIRDIRAQLENAHNYYVYMGTNKDTDLIHSVIICYQQKQAGATEQARFDIAETAAQSNTMHPNPT